MQAANERKMLENILATVKYRLERRIQIDVNEPLSPENLSYLHVAVVCDRVDVVKLLLINHAAVDPVATKKKFTPLYSACEKGFTGVVAALLAHGANVHAVTSESWTPLHVAAQHGSAAVVAMLIAKQARVNAVMDKGASPLFIAAQHGHTDVVAVLLKNHALVDAAVENGETPLSIACDRGNARVVSALLAAGADGDSPNARGSTLLQIAAGRGQLDVVSALLSKRDDVDGAVLRGAKALFYAAEQGKMDVVSVLLAAQVDANSANEMSWTALHIAAEQGHANVAAVLLDNKANVDAADANDRTPLHWAAWHGNLEVVRVLLDKKASVDAGDVRGTTPLHVSAQNGHVDIVKMLLERHASVNTVDVEGMTALFVAAREGHVDVVNALLAARATVDVADNNGWTPLHRASGAGHANVVSALLSTGQADVNAVNVFDWTPLHFASRLGHGDVVAVLLANRANVDATDTSGSTPLHAATVGGHVAVVGLLLKNYANVNAVDMSDATPLFGAVYENHTSIVELLLSHEAGLAERQDGEPTTTKMPATHTTADMVYSYGRALLDLAAQHGNVKLVKMLLASKARVDALTVDYNGVSPLHIAAAAGNMDVASALLEHGANVNGPAVCENMPNSKDIAGVTPLHVAVRNGHTSMLALLLASNANIEAATASGETPLHTAACLGHLEVLSALLRKHANVDAADAAGTTALHFAASNGSADAVRELLAYQANPSAVTTKGETPLHYAVRHGRMDAIQCLLVAQTKLDNALAETGASEVSHPVRTVALSKSDGLVSNMPSVQQQPPISAFEPIYRKLACLEATDKKGNTLVLAAARSGHFDVVKTLIEAGALVHVRATDGETVLTAAARQKNYDAVSQLLDLERLTPSSAAHGEESLLSATLKTLRGYEDQTHEFQALWRRAVDRLIHIYERLEANTPRKFLLQFAMSVCFSVRLKPRCSQYGILSRLVSSSSVAIAFRDLHSELDFLEHQIDSEALHSAASESFEADCDADEAGLLKIFQEKTTGAAIFEEYRDARGMSILEDVTLIGHFLRENDDKVSQELRDLLNFSADTIMKILQEWGRYPVSKASGVIQVVEAPLAPRWFIPEHETELNWISRDPRIATGSVATGRWLNAAISFSQHSLLEHAQFDEIVERCFPLRHSNVIEVFGAWHHQQPFAAIYERASHTNLREYLAREENKHLRWRKLHEVSLGLQYLFDREVFVESLTCAHIWVGTDGKAKINALTACAASQEASGLERLRWQAPEVVRGAAPSSSSSIYSLAMCFYEALSGKIPWETEVAVLLTSTQITSRSRPKLPEDVTSDQRTLLTQMWLTDPSKRPSIAHVEQHLKRIADEEQKAHGKDEELTEWIDLERTKIPELFDYSMKDSLENLEDRCKRCRDSKDAMQHIVRRLRDVYNLVRKLDHLPATSPIITHLRDVMQNLRQFFGKARSSNSLLLLAKKQKVTLASDIFHRQLDKLLLMVAPKIVNSIHTWKQHASASGTPLQTTTLEKGGNIVKIKRIQHERLDERFKELDFTAIDAAVADPSMSRTVRPPWLVYLHEISYDKDASLGKGSFGKVYMAKWLGASAVIKFMGYEADQDESSRELFFHELRVWFPLSHPNVVKLLGACHVGKVFFVCEFAGNGTLKKYLQLNGGGANKSWQLLYQAAQGLEYMHKLNILHNDLTCANILIGTNGEAQLSDFGLSCILNSAEVKVDQKNQGMLQSRSPEYLRGGRLTLKSDIYAFAMCILEAMTGEPPWSNADDVMVRRWVNAGKLPQKPLCLSESQWALIEMMCVADPARRVDISFVVSKLDEFAQQQVPSQNKKVVAASKPTELVFTSEPPGGMSHLLGRLQQQAATRQKERAATSAP